MVAESPALQHLKRAYNDCCREKIQQWLAAKEVMESLAPMSFQQFKNDFKELYQALVHNGDWDKPPNGETILALQAEAADLKKKLAKVQKKKSAIREQQKMTKTGIPITNDFPPGFETTSKLQVTETAPLPIKGRTGAGLSNFSHPDLTKAKSTLQTLAAY